MRPIEIANPVSGFEALLSHFWANDKWNEEDGCEALISHLFEKDINIKLIEYLDNKITTAAKRGATHAIFASTSFVCAVFY